MASNHYGGSVTLTATFTPISASTVGMTTISVRNGLTNHTVDLGNADGQTGYLDVGDSKAYHNMRPADIFVRGTAGEVIYWDGNG